MLKLKRVELQGFKSFCDRTELKFNGGGIAAVVGPNGCGKSNLSDAISWVLGEQSAKTLRGARMEDVIFAGTRDRKPVGMASVTMTLLDPANYSASGLHVITAGNGHSNGHTNGHSNGHGHAAVAITEAANGHPAPTGEVTITRRLFRSGESEYLVNGKIARLRDIQDLFMGTGLGPESYAIIEQGRIGQILSSRPQDRRAVIEEAAGITKYKTRRRLAEAKLESAKQNLARVFDILEEVTRQVNSLKRQAAKTRRYGELKAELDERLKALLAGKFRLLERDAVKAALDLNAASAELKTLGETVARQEEEHGRLQALSYETEKRLTEARGHLAASNVEMERTRGTLASQVKETGAIEQRIAQRERESAEMEIRLGQLDGEVSVHRKNVAGLEREIALSRERMLQKTQAREQLLARLREREQAMEAGRMLVLRLLGEASTLKNQLAQIDEYLAGIERETARTEREEQTVAAEMERLAAAKKSLSENMAQRQMEIQAVTGERQQTEAALSEARQTALELQVQIDQLRSASSQLQARKESIEQVLEHRTYTTDAVKKLFGAIEKGKARDVQPLGVLADFVEVDRVYERSAEEFLHDELEYVVVENWRQADQGIDFLRTDLEGRATFLVHPEKPREEEAPLPAPSEGVVGPLSQYLRLTNGFKERATSLLPRMANCFIAEDRASAQKLAVEYPHLYFLLPDGLCYHGHTLSGGKKTASGPLALKREARELGVALKSKTAQLEEQLGRSEQVRQEIQKLEQQLERLRGLQQAREKDAVALDHELRKLTEESNRANSRVSVARLELERLRRENQRSLEQRDKSRAAVAQKDEARAEKEAALEAQRQELEILEAESAAIGEEHAALRVELAGLEERHRGERNATQKLESQIKDVRERRAQIAPEIEGLAVERARLLADNIDLDRKAADLAQGIAELEGIVDRLAAEESGQRETLRGFEEELKALRIRVEAGHETRSQLEIELVRKQSELKFLDETSRKELNIAVEELAAATDIIADGEALAEIERQYLEVKNKIEALGGVNPSALEEYQEAQQRQEFLNAQRQDLLDSIRDTEKAIQEIDAVSRQRFAEAFEAINENFRKSFVTLFGGGSAEMRLTDETNANESGLDIVASPPGKKLQNVLLLSGGEKALAALALLMAVFKYQPSPFCILDEVDAPLDEPNIERLTRLLREMAVETQFILITHSKKTMESAQSMYGVTMQEPGVSKLVSVKFEQPQAEIVTSA